jgi:uncharacterized protein (TIGR00725 family)
VKPEDYEHQARATGDQLAVGPRVGVIGSTSFWGKDSEEICEKVGRLLACVEEIVLLTGGMTGVAEVVGRSFFRARQLSGLAPSLYHILPNGSSRWDFGETLFAGSTYYERREILGRLARVYVAIEGGPGTVHEAEVARSRNAVLVPVGRTGGFAGELFPRVRCPLASCCADWAILNDVAVSTDTLAEGVLRIVQQLLACRAGSGGLSLSEGSCI